MAKESSKCFMVYYDYRQHLTLLTDEERGRLFMALLDYGETNKEPELQGATLMAFSFIRSQMDRDAEKYAETCRKRSEAGKKGGRPPKQAEDEEAKKTNAFSEKQRKAKKGDTDTVTDTETETDKETDTDTVTVTDTGIPPNPPRGKGAKRPTGKFDTMACLNEIINGEEGDGTA